eukprot:scaffold1141_cov128-Isochrysis_galbana.AAC.9
MRLLLAKRTVLAHLTISHQGSDQPARGDRKWLIESQISLKQKSTATLRSPCAGPTQGPAQVLRRVLRRVQGPQDLAPCTLRNILGGDGGGGGSLMSKDPAYAGRGALALWLRGTLNSVIYESHCETVRGVSGLRFHQRQPERAREELILARVQCAALLAVRVWRVLCACARACHVLPLARAWPWRDACEML